MSRAKAPIQQESSVKSTWKKRTPKFKYSIVGKKKYAGQDFPGLIKNRVRPESILNDLDKKSIAGGTSIKITGISGDLRISPDIQYKGPDKFLNKN